MRSHASWVAHKAFLKQLKTRIKLAEKRKGRKLTKEERQAELDWIKRKIIARENPRPKPKKLSWIDEEQIVPTERFTLIKKAGS